MKVIVSGYVGKKITGIGRSLMSWLDAIDDENMEFVVYTNKDMLHDLKFNNLHVKVKTYGISRESSIGNLLWTTFMLPLMAIKEKADVTLITNFTLLLFPVKPTVIFLHDMTEYKVPQKQSKLRVFYRTKLAIPISAKKATRVVTVSQNSKKDIQEILGLPDEKIDFVYNGIDRKKFSQIDREKYMPILTKKSWNEKAIVYVGTVDHPGRNLISLVKAYENLKEKKLFVGQLIIAGRSGKGAEVVYQYIKNSKYTDDIKVTGYITDEELLALYSSCAVFCYLSLYEGFGMPPVEAMSCGAHVIVSNTSSLPEAVGNVGVLVNPQNVEEIERAIVMCTKSVDVNGYKEKINEHLRKFSWKTEGQKLAQVIRKARD